MKRKRVKVIYFAVALSIAAHFLLGPLIHVKFVDAAPEKKIPHVTITRIVPPTPSPTKPPIQKSTPHKPQHSKRSQPRAPHVANTSNPDVASGGAVQKPGDGTDGTPTVSDTGTIGVATAAPTATPAITPTPKPACSAPYVEASTIEKYAPEMPTMAREQGLSGNAEVQVDLSASGQVLNAKIVDSTGSSLLDNAAVDAAKRTTYSPKIVDCNRAPGSYLFRVEFKGE